jgi:hypothetical protein
LAIAAAVVWGATAVVAWRTPRGASAWLPKISNPMLPLLMISLLPSRRLPDPLGFVLGESVFALVLLLTLRSVSHWAWPLPGDISPAREEA